MDLYYGNLTIYLTIHESQPPQNITHAGHTVRGSKDSVDTVHDVVSIPAAVPGIFNFSFTSEDISERAAELGLEFGKLRCRLGRGKSHGESETGKDDKELGHGDLPNSRPSSAAHSLMSSLVKEKLKMPGTAAGMLTG